jgi:hypothetical protein
VEGVVEVIEPHLLEALGIRRNPRQGKRYVEVELDAASAVVVTHELDDGAEVNA